MEENLLKSFKDIGVNQKRDELSLELMKITYLLNQEFSKYEGRDTMPMAYDYEPDTDFVKTESDMLDIYYADIIRIEDALQLLIKLSNK